MNSAHFSFPRLSALTHLSPGSMQVSSPGAIAWKHVINVINWAIIGLISLIFHILGNAILCCLWFSVLKIVGSYALSSFFGCSRQEVNLVPVTLLAAIKGLSVLCIFKFSFLVSLVGSTVHVCHFTSCPSIKSLHKWLWLLLKIIHTVYSSVTSASWSWDSGLLPGLVAHLQSVTELLCCL